MILLCLMYVEICITNAVDRCATNVANCMCGPQSNLTGQLAGSYIHEQLFSETGAQALFACSGEMLGKMAEVSQPKVAAVKNLYKKDLENKRSLGPLLELAYKYHLNVEAGRLGAEANVTPGQLGFDGVVDARRGGGGAAASNWRGICHELLDAVNRRMTQIGAKARSEGKPCFPKVTQRDRAKIKEEAWRAMTSDTREIAPKTRAACLMGEEAWMGDEHDDQSPVNKYITNRWNGIAGRTIKAKYYPK